MAECCSLSNSDLQCYRSVCRMEVLLVPDCSCSIKHLLQLWAATWQQQWDWTGFLHCSWTDTHSRICVQSWKRRSSVLHWLQSTSVCLVCRSVCFCLLRNRYYISSVHCLNDDKHTVSWKNDLVSLTSIKLNFTLSTLLGGIYLFPSVLTL